VSTPTSSRASGSTSTWVGIVLGLVLLGLVAAFAIALPKASGEESHAVSEEPLSLPDTLPGGYAAADDPAAFDGTDLEAQAKEIAKQQAEAATYTNKVLPDVLGHPATARTYVANGSTPVYVQVFRAEGGALAPQSMLAPHAADDGGTTMAKVGEGVCILIYGQPQSGGSGDPLATQCQVTRDGVTVQVQASGLEAKDLVAAGSGLLDDLVGEGQDQ
jgi:hypothetical protein